MHCKVAIVKFRCFEKLFSRKYHKLNISEDTLQIVDFIIFELFVSENLRVVISLHVQLCLNPQALYTVIDSHINPISIKRLRKVDINCNVKNVHVLDVILLEPSYILALKFMDNLERKAYVDNQTHTNFKFYVTF